MNKPEKPQRQRPKAKRIKIGAIVEFAVKGGFAYAQYIHKATYSGPCIRIFKGIYPERLVDPVALANQKEQLITFYPITSRHNEGFYEVVGWAPVPEHLQELPLFKSLWDPSIPFITSYFWRLVNGETGESWRVGDKTSDRQKVSEILPEEYHHLPTWCICCKESLIDRIELGWTHETDVFGPTYAEFCQQRAQKEAAAAPPPKAKSVSERLPSPRPNPIEKSLQKLLNRLDGIMEKHEEVQDTDVREQLHEAMYNAFVLAKADYELPEEFGMYTKTGNKSVRSALATFLKKANDMAAKAGLDSEQIRLAAFQDIDVTSENGSTYDEYFGEL